MEPNKLRRQTSMSSLSDGSYNELDKRSDYEYDDDDLIPTAIVIKNIPFAIKKEQLLDSMTKLGLPLPYAFNYHFDNGVFRGLAFANFTSSDETSAVVNNLNGREIGGRKLRVEYKKMLPAQERERIEREKREKRGQLEEQHRNGEDLRSNSNVSLVSLLSQNLNVPSTNVASAPPPKDRAFMNYPINSSFGQIPADLNFNDIETLEIFSQFLLFKDDLQKGELAINLTNTTPSFRKTVSLLSQFLNLIEIYDQNFIMIKKKNVINNNNNGNGNINNIRRTNNHTPTLQHVSSTSNLNNPPGLSSGVPYFNSKFNTLRSNTRSYIDMRSTPDSPLLSPTPEINRFQPFQSFGNLHQSYSSSQLNDYNNLNSTQSNDYNNLNSTQLNDYNNDLLSNKLNSMNLNNLDSNIWGPK